MASRWPWAPLPTHQQYVVVADQAHDRMALYFRKPGSNQFDSPVPIDAARSLLAPGAVQQFVVPGDRQPYLVVPNSLSNTIAVYHGTGPGQFGLLSTYAVGFD